MFATLQKQIYLTQLEEVKMIQRFIEIPNTNIREEVTRDFAYDLLYDMAQQYGKAQLVWYALNGTRVIEGEYTDKD